ncbi:hypothetical protein [Pseudaminobacter sp. NGMCC 1.201702]|uniref:hypothetical protein n=1 Tax=Pseudaminobacter sp. NGMCC 1.201702 TaxID=3391825 RepID=UPI0039F0BB2D
MKTGLTTSIAIHAALLAFGMLTLSAPSALEVADVESLPVDIVPIEDITQIQQGDKTATVNEKPAPKPTKRPDIVPDAQKVGENTVDTEKKPTPEAKPKPVETADAPPPSPEPMPKPADQPKPEPVKQPEAKPTPVPATEVTPQPEPKQEVKPDPVAETIAAEQPEAESVELPNSAPSPAARPQPPQAQTAKAPERKEAEKQPVKEAATKPKSTEKSFNADEVAALLNKEKASGGGAKRSTEQAALGGDKSTGGSKLSQSEMDALRGQVQRCWNIPAGALDGDTLKVSVKFKLDPSGALEGSPEIISGGGSSGVERAAAEAARRAVARCAPYNLPADKYDAWADVIVNFDPSEMF